MFGEDEQQAVTDQALVDAIRKRLLQEIMQEQQGTSPNIDIQNIVGGGGRGQPPAGVFEGMRGGGAEPPMEDPSDYSVDITRTKMWPDTPIGTFPEPGPGGEIGDPIGWHKSVRRFRTPRGQEIETQKKK